MAPFQNDFVINLVIAELYRTLVIDGKKNRPYPALTRCITSEPVVGNTSGNRSLAGRRFSEW